MKANFTEASGSRSFQGAPPESCITERALSNWVQTVTIPYGSQELQSASVEVARSKAKPNGHGMALLGDEALVDVICGHMHLNHAHLLQPTALPHGSTRQRCCLEM